jgi:hypothetical protein
MGSSQPEHAVIVHFEYGTTDLGPLNALENRLIEEITAAGVGEYDGNEIAVDGSDGFLYMYGPSGDQLFAVVRPVLEEAAFMKGARARIRYGPPSDGVKQSEVVLGG